MYTKRRRDVSLDFNFRLPIAGWREMAPRLLYNSSTILDLR
ncbi:hypothetical protein GCWU000324_02690 [Kingella oralis ATCC 51147]|uniref:Uncharacterized protein n=1 Tax=Kingella oralis ATCC 51147 TaxID=629741 RepID=C4GLW7_9NEIS|nr:hypothetical protein GCWU000324_02690 [Kingella oralis ATCC 51147]